MSEPIRPDLTPDLTAPETTDAPGIAREQFVHGLLEWLHLDRPEKREKRIEAVLDALHEETGPVVLASWRARHWRLVSGLAAAVVLASLVLLGLPTQTTAVAMVQATLAASKTAGDRRYEVRVTPPGGTEVEKDAMGTLDVRDADHVVIQARTPFGDQIVVGRNENGAWAIRPDGTLDRYPPRQAWPNWVNFGQSTVLLVSIDELMTWLEKSYTLKKSDPAAVPSGQGVLCNRITAEHKPGPSPDPVRVELWIDQQSRVVRRMELHWNPRPGPMPCAGGGDDAGPGPDGGPQDFPPDRRPGPDQRPDRRPPPDRGPDDGPGAGPESGPDMGPDRRPEGGSDQEPGVRRPPPRDIGPLDPDAPRRPPPQGPPDGGPRRRPPHPRPEFLGGPPDFNGGHHPPPPREITFDLVEGAKFADGWFEPAAHAPTPTPATTPDSH